MELNELRWTWSRAANSHSFLHGTLVTCLSPSRKLGSLFLIFPETTFTPNTVHLQTDLLSTHIQLLFELKVKLLAFKQSIKMTEERRLKPLLQLQNSLVDAWVQRKMDELVHFNTSRNRPRGFSDRRPQSCKLNNRKSTPLSTHLPKFENYKDI